VAALVAALGSRRVMSTTLVLTLCPFGVVGAGALQAGLGFPRLGTIVKYTLHP
jgi:hypothetical protein